MKKVLLGHGLSCIYRLSLGTFKLHEVSSCLDCMAHKAEKISFQDPWSLC